MFVTQCCMLLNTSSPSSDCVASHALAWCRFRAFEGVTTSTLPGCVKLNRRGRRCGYGSNNYSRNLKDHKWFLVLGTIQLWLSTQFWPIAMCKFEVMLRMNNGQLKGTQRWIKPQLKENGDGLKVKTHDTCFLGWTYI
jgi:hypothetical protein